MKGVRGILTWFHGDVPAPDEYLTWAASVLDSGKKLVVLAELGVSADTPGVSSVDVNAIWTRLGLESDGQWVRMTYDLEVVHGDPELVGFERSLGGILPSYPVMRTSGESAHAHLVVARPGSEGTESALVVVSEGGGFIAPGYALYAPRPELVQWRVNPFEFFRRAFSTDELPKPDTTTISGWRIFYSHIDGDGWRNGSEIPAYVEERAYASEVILREVLERFDDLPVSVAPVVGDLDPDWYGDATTLRIAREIFALPHVEAGSHTYSHPLDWGYFDPDDPAARGRTPKKNHRATDRDWRRHEWLRSVIGWMESSGLVTVREPTKTVADAVDGLYDRRRSNELEPFDLSKEIAGSVEFIRRLLPPGKDVAIVQWSGNTKPFPEAIASVRRLGLRNINGGDSRLDVEFPSYAWVAPLGIRVGRELQVFASNSNENTYTDLWTDRFFGFKHLLKTIENTESPIRIKPFNVYYHMCSGEKLASLNAVLENMRVARQTELAPVTTSRYASMADGFFSARIVRLDRHRWRIEERDGVETLRFDHAESRAVDWDRSQGVIGQRHFQGSLYVALDGAVSEPVVALEERVSKAAPEAPYLIEGRWRVFSIERSRDSFSFAAQGYGRGNMSWYVPTEGLYEITVEREGQKRRTRVSSHGSRTLDLDGGASAIVPVHVNVQRIDPS